MITRRGLIRGLIAAPAIVGAGSIMPINWRLVSTATVDVDAWGWRVVHRGTGLGLSHWFDDLGCAVAAANEIDARFNLDKLALQIMRGETPASARDAIFEIQSRHIGMLNEGHKNAEVPPERTREIIRKWARLPQHQPINLSAGQGT